MQMTKVQVLAEAGVVRAVDVGRAADARGWTVAIAYASRTGARREVLERQRGGVRAFATLDAVARCLAGAGLSEFRVNVAGRAGAGDEPP
jgi:hypothetical protein